MSKYDKIIIVLVVIMIAVVAGSSMGYLHLPQAIGGGANTTQPEQASVATCEQSTSLNLSNNVFDSTPGNQSTSLNSDYNILYFFGSNYAGSVAAGTQITGIPSGTTVTLYAISGTKLGVGTTAYNFSKVVQMGCKSDTVMLSGAEQSAITSAMYDISTGTDVANSSTAATAVGAGQTAKAKLYVQASTANKRYGTTELGAKVLAVFDYNNLDWKQPVVDSVDGGTAVLDVVPNGHSNNAVTADGTASVAYLVTTNNLVNNGSVTIKFHADALTATTNPTAADGNIGVTLYDSQMYQKLDGTWVVGFRNADSGTDLAATNATKVFYAS